VIGGRAPRSRRPGQGGDAR